MKVDEGNVSLGEVTTDNPMVEPPGVQETVEEEPTEQVEEPEPQADGEEPVETEAYNPDFNYKVFDEQREFPEYVRSLITDKESEDRVRSLFCKADALEPMKEKYKGEKTARESWETRFEELDGKYNHMAKTVDEANHYAQNDLNSFFKFMGIPRDAVLKYATEQLDALQNPEQQQAFDQRSQQTQQSFQYQTQMQDMQQTNVQLLKRQHEADMRDATSTPEISSFIKSFEEKQGEGSFMQAVNDLGDAHYLKTKRYLAPHDAVQKVYQQYSGFINTQPTQTAPAQEVPQATHTPPPTLPNVGRGGGVSPIKKIPKSLDELREYAKNFEG